MNPGKLLLSAVGSLTQPLFNKGQNIARLKIAKAQQEEAKLSFTQTLLNAGAEVNNALKQNQTARDKSDLYQRQISSLQTAVTSTQLLMQHGNSTYLEVLTAQQTLLTAQLTQVSNRFQELLHKIPTKKLSTKRLKPLTYLKYAVLLVMVFLLPAFLVNDVGMGDPFFCKYLCPQGVLEGAIPLSVANSGIRAALGTLFTWKLGILIAVIVLSVLFYRPFCKWLCPLGAFYALLNKVSLFQMKVDKNKCVSCGKCAKACKMDVDVTKTPNHTECIRCGMCVRACPTNAVRFRYGFGDGKDKSIAAETPQTNNNNENKEEQT